MVCRLFFLLHFAEIDGVQELQPIGNHGNEILELS